MTDTIKFILPETDILRDWYNPAADLPPPLFPMALAGLPSVASG
jgi:predicted alternative tryptophan synthase beta-subunit